MNLNGWTSQNGILGISKTLNNKAYREVDNRIKQFFYLKIRREVMREEIKFLKELQKQMQYENEHDYDGQASPRFWTIMDYRKVPGNPDYDSCVSEYFFNDGDHIPFENFQDLKEFIEEHYEEEIEEDEDLKMILEENNFDELWEYIGWHLNGDGYFDEVSVKEEEFIRPNTMFLTKEEAKSHLELNHYHYTSKAHTYAMTAWRAPKVEKLINILLNFDWDSIEKTQ